MENAAVSDKELTSSNFGASRLLRMETALRAAFSPTSLQIIDESDRHAGHAGAHPEGQTHYIVRMQAAAFAPLSRIERQRAVNRVLQPEFETGLHALVLELTA
jgi:BolA family transcriptional regulator, general stress-responsive regulator